MNDFVWNVRIAQCYVNLDFRFESADKAVAFARTAAKTYQADKENLEVSIRPMFAENVTVEKEEEE